MISRSPVAKTSLAFVFISLVCLVYADLEITTLEPWTQMRRMAVGFLTPSFFTIGQLFEVVVQTAAFALLGVFSAAVIGFGLALSFHWRAVRMFCAVIRAVHELFWALIFLQIFGLTALTGVLAIAIPFAGVFGKVYAEILEEADQAPLKTLPSGTSRVAQFLFARLPDVWAHFYSYTLYRFECGLRSSAILGFVGLPTIGFHLESAFKQGNYSEASALLIVFYILIATLRYWMRRRLIPVYLLAAVLLLADGSPIHWHNIVTFFTHDVVPYPLRVGAWSDASTWSEFRAWCAQLFSDEALPGAIATILLSQIALTLTGVLALGFYPLISRYFFGVIGRNLGHVFLVITRSTPEYILAYIFLQLWGPSMLPAVVALALHNAAIIGHLIGRHTDELTLRPDHPSGLNLYAFETTPRVYGQFLAFLFYRWEVIARETAILGMLGIYTLGFYVDSAFQEIRFDRALVLIGFTALLNVVIDIISRRLRARLRLQTSSTCG
jgi:phosphonate transport system permease protein